MRTLVIEKGVLRYNLMQLRAISGQADIMADLRGDGQGVGLLRMARFLREEGIGSFAVDELRDVRRLRDAGFTEERILMLRSATEREELSELLELHAVCTVGSNDAAIALNGLAAGQPLGAETRIRIDTGLGQHGFLPTETDKILNIYRNMPALSVGGVYACLSGTGIRRDAEAQVTAFREAVDALRAAGLEPGVVQVLDELALLRGRQEEQTAVMIGAGLLGRLPLGADRQLKRLGRIEATLECVKWLDQGTRIGSGNGTALKKPTRVAVADIGWYHGVGLSREGLDGHRSLLQRLRTLLGGAAPALYVRGKRVRILGEVGMTGLALDVTRCEPESGDVVSLEVDPRLARGLDVEMRE